MAKSRLLAGLAVFAVLAAACSSGGATTAPESQAPAASEPAASAPAASEPAASGSAPAGGSYKIGFSNPLGVGNGFREEQLCTAKAQALVSGQVESGTWIHRNTDAAGQLSDIRDLIAADVDAIVFNPLDPEALNPALDEAQAKGIITVAIDAAVTDPETINLSNDQVEYAYKGATWLFDQMGGEGKVWYTRGIPGHPADTDRDEGFKKALAEHPNIEVVPNADGVHTNWDPATATQLANDFIASGEYDNVQGIWTSGMDSQVVDAIKAAGKPYVPIVGADLRAFVEQLLNTSGDYEGLTGIAVYNPAAVGGAGVKLAIDILNGQTPETGENNTVLLPEPPAYDNVSEEGKAKLQEIDVPEIDPLYPVSWYIDGLTDYTLDEMLACKGPGE
jgi:ribose transport system substrate-binding protein